MEDRRHSMDHPVWIGDKMLECFRLGNEQSTSISVTLKYQSPFANSFADNIVNVHLLFFYCYNFDLIHFGRSKFWIVLKKFFMNN